MLDYYVFNMPVEKFAIVLVCVLIMLRSVFLLTVRVIVPKLQAIMSEGKLGACPHNRGRNFKNGKIYCDACGAKIGTF